MALRFPYPEDTILIEADRILGPQNLNQFDNDCGTLIAQLGLNKYYVE